MLLKCLSRYGLGVEQIIELGKNKETLEIKVATFVNFE